MSQQTDGTRYAKSEFQLPPFIQVPLHNKLHNVQSIIRKATYVCAYIYCSFHVPIIKGEVRSWSNLISEERVKFSEQNSENLMKIGLKIRKLWNLKFRKFSGNISWPVRMNMQMSELMMSSPHNFPFILYTEMTKFHISAMRMLDLP